MAIVQSIEIDGRQVPFKASAAIPRVYRARFHRDIFKDLDALATALGEHIETGDGADTVDGADTGEVNLSSLDVSTLETFENIAYIMAKYADPAVPNSIEEWLDGFNTFSIYLILPQLLALWSANMATEAESKKNLDRLTAR